MLPIRLTVLIILTLTGLSLHAQQLKPDDFTALAKCRLEKLDSFFTAKKFEKASTKEEDGFTLSIYNHPQPGADFESVHVAWIPKIKSLNLEYGFTKKTDADNFANQLIQAGFKKSVTSMPSIDGSKFTTTSYKKGKNNIGYREMHDPVNIYIFTIEDER